MSSECLAQSPLPPSDGTEGSYITWHPTLIKVPCANICASFTLFLHLGNYPWPAHKFSLTSKATKVTQLNSCVNYGNRSGLKWLQDDENHSTPLEATALPCWHTQCSTCWKPSRHQQVARVGFRSRYCTVRYCNRIQYILQMYL